MAVKKNFLDRFSERFDDLDSGSRQAYILRLAREKGFLETVFNSIEEGVLVVDQNLRIRYFNRAAKSLLGLPDDISRLRVSQLLRGVNWRQIIGEDEEEWSRLARQEVEIMYPERRFVQLYLVPLPEDTKLASVILRDVTENRKRTRSELESETVKAVSQLAAGVAHEIGNPLNSLSLNLQILEQSVNDLDTSDAMPPEEMQEMIRICKSEVERLDSIIHGFLTDLRPAVPEFKIIDLRELIVDVLKFMRSEIEARKVEVKCSWSANLPPVTADAKQLKQAFYNIIRNAVQAMSNGGILEIFGYADPENWIVEFSDSGSGVDSDRLRSMFNAFETGRAGGNGIGTMVIERVCRAHGADFGIISSPGRGLVFQVKFPLGKRQMRLLGDS
ncbi:MAG: PAS domain-containing protein [Lentisphaeria bacterium]|nr:PAS domain-containing protein [Lentisphaeria bacterium]